MSMRKSILFPLLAYFTERTLRATSIVSGSKADPRWGFRITISRSRASEYPCRSYFFSPKTASFRRLGDAKFQQGFGWNPDFLLCLGIKTRARLFCLTSLPKHAAERIRRLFEKALVPRSQSRLKRDMSPRKRDCIQSP